MVVLSRKRVLISISILSGLYLIIRYLHGSFLSHTTTSITRVPGTPVLVMVFYEALCPDSKHFITKQLVPSHQKLGSFIDLQLIPYGKAKTIPNQDGSYSFECQHGALECEANIYHACTLEAIDDVTARLDMITCMIRDNRKPKEALQKCAKQHNIENIDLIIKCYDSSHGAELLKLNGDATNAIRPPITFIPFITLDGSPGRQAAILKNLFGEVCKLLGELEICNSQTTQQ